MLNEHQKAKLGSWIAERLGADGLNLLEVRPLKGGAIQENCCVRCVMEGGRTREFVLRKDAS